MTLQELDDELNRLSLWVRWTPNGLKLAGETANATPKVLAALKEHKPRLALMLKPVEQPKMCAGFRTKMGKKGLVHVPCNALYWNAADCAVACIYRNCPQKGPSDEQ